MNDNTGLRTRRRRNDDIKFEPIWQHEHYISKKNFDYAKNKPAAVQVENRTERRN